MLNLKAFKSFPYTVYTFSTLVGFLGIYTCTSTNQSFPSMASEFGSYTYTALTYLDISAINASVSPDISFYLIAIANAASLFGRLSSGFLGDRLGPMNVLIPYTLAAAIFTYSWPYARTIGTLAVIALLYG
jgi:MFS transporter, MCT family, solute carrier family 16 (monocarboxylic acid transporters), member 10